MMTLRLPLDRLQQLLDHDLHLHFADPIATIHQQTSVINVDSGRPTPLGLLYDF
jgi:hypothetical protein